MYLKANLMESCKANPNRKILSSCSSSTKFPNQKPKYHLYKLQ